jgi:hypothetical protein
MLTGSKRTAVAIAAAFVVVTASTSAVAWAQSAVTSPKQHFGFTIGDDYQLATYTHFAAYWQ